MKAPTATHLNFPHKTAVLDTQLFAKYMFARLKAILFDIWCIKPESSQNKINLLPVSEL